MNRKKKFDCRCPICQMRKELCICPEIAACRAQLDIKTRVVILMHKREKTPPPTPAASPN
jgi:DTW domain-containing protein YfiP